MPNLYSECPNCGSKNPTRNIYRCGANDFFCDDCTGRIITPILKLRVDTCPQCGGSKYVAVARIHPAAENNGGVITAVGDVQLSNAR